MAVGGGWDSQRNGTHMEAEPWVQVKEDSCLQKQSKSYHVEEELQ